MPPSKSGKHTSTGSSSSLKHTSPRTSPKDSISSPSFRRIQDRFKGLYAKYQEYKVQYPTIFINVEELLKNIPEKFMVKKEPHLLSIGTIKNVLCPPKYDKIIRTLKYNEDTLDLSEKHVTLREYKKERLHIISVTDTFLDWFSDKIKESLKTVNTANKKDLLSKLPSDIKSAIITNVSPDSRSRLRATSTTMREMIPREEVSMYLKANHPNFIRAFKKALFEYKTTQSEKEILQKHKEKYALYLKIMQAENARGLYLYSKNDYVDNDGVFPEVIVMYFKLLNASNMNPKYIYALSRVYYYKLSVLDYKQTYGGDDVVLMNIDFIIRHELHKIYILMFLLSPDKKPFVYDNLSEAFKAICLNLEKENEYIKKYLLPPVSKEKIYECYLYIFDSIRVTKNIETIFTDHNFIKMKKKAPISSSSQKTLITIPQEITSMKDLQKHPIAKLNTMNCLEHIMTNKAGITNYTKEGEKLNLLSAFGL